VTLRALLAGEAEPADLLMPVSDRLWLLPAESGAEVVHALGAVDRARLHLRLCTLMDRFDVAVVDAGTGIDSVMRTAMARAARVVAITTPEPAALSDTYALIKILSLNAPALPVELVVNRTTDEAEATDAVQRLQEAAERFLGRPVVWLGEIRESDELSRAVRQPGRLPEHHPLVDPLVTRLLATALDSSERSVAP
jgi:flagellar biosynthesis protein FlhG